MPMTLFARSYRPFTAVLSLALTVSCNEQPNKTVATAQQADVPKRDTAVEVMEERDILLNGKLPRYFSMQEFRSALGEPDSSRLLADEEPCTNIFQETDGSVDPEARYLYKNGSRYENVKEKAAIDEVRFSDGDFIVFKGHTLNKQTTMTDLKKLFPNAAQQATVTDVAGEGQLDMICLREDKNNISDGHIRLYVKNGRLFALQWWFPC